MISIYKTETIDQNINTVEIINSYPLSSVENKKRNFDGWDLTITLPIKLKEHIKQGYLIESDTKEDGKQFFRVHNYEYDKTRIEIVAYHVMFDMKDYLIEELKRENVTVINAFIAMNNNLDRPSPFTILGYFEKLVDLDIYVQSLLDVAKAVVETTGAYVKADNWDIEITDSIGLDTHESVAYGKNLYNFSYRENFDDVITKIYPYFMIGEERVVLPEKYIESDYRYNIEYTKAVQFEPRVETHLPPATYPDGTVEENPPLDTVNLVEDLREQATKSLEITQFPKISYKVSSTLNVSFRIGDIVHFKHPALTKAVPLSGNNFEDLSIPLEVYSYEYDLVAKSLNALTYGDYDTEPYDKIRDFATEIVLDKTQSIKDFITENKGAQGVLDRVKYNIEQDLTKKQQQLDAQALVIDNLNKNGHLVIYDNELFAVDQLPLSAAVNVLNLGQGGLTFSTSGINGPWNAAIGIDGKINASQILTGELDASIIKTNTIQADALSVEARESILLSVNNRIDDLSVDVNLRLNTTDGVIEGVVSQISGEDGIQERLSVTTQTANSVKTELRDYKTTVNGEFTRVETEFNNRLDGFGQNYVRNERIRKNLVSNQNIAEWEIEYLGPTMAVYTLDLGLTEEGVEYTLEGVFPNYREYPEMDLYDISVNMVGHTFTVDTDTTYNLTEQGIKVVGDGVQELKIELTYLHPASEESSPKDMGIIMDISTGAEITNLWTVFDYNAPSNTIMLGRSDNPIEMRLSNDMLQFKSRETGQVAYFSHSGMYNQQWTNDQHMAKSFSENGVTGTVWADKGSKI